MLSQAQAIAGTILSVAIIIAGLGRALMLLHKMARGHEQLRENVATILAGQARTDRALAKFRRRLRRVENELGLRPRNRVATTTTEITETHERLIP